MSTNLITAIMQSLPSEAISKIASSLGLEPSAVQKGIEAGIPGLLAGLANTASSSNGAQRLTSALSHIRSLPGEDIVRGVTDANPKTLADTGWPAISALIGGNSMETLSSVVAQFAGIGQGSAKSLLGLLAPLVLGFLRREQVTGGLDSGGIASLLSSQRANIERAIPPGTTRRFQEAVVPVENQRAAPSGFGRQSSAPRSEAARSWAYWLLPALILAGAALYLLPEQDTTRVAQDINKNTTTIAAKESPLPAPQHELQPAAVTTAQPAATAPESLENSIVSNIQRLRASLQTIKDPTSSRAAVNELKDISDKFGKLRALAQQLPPETRKAIAAAVAARVPDLDSLIAHMDTQVNLSEEAKPAIDRAKSELSGISKG